MIGGDAALGRLSGLYMGFGNFGLNLGLSLARIVCKDFGLNAERFVKHVRVSDFYPGLHFEELRRRWGLSCSDRGAEGDIIDAEAHRCCNYLSYGEIASSEELPYNITAGVGSYWPLSAYHARKNFPSIYSKLVSDLEQKAGRRITDFNIFIYAASSGGGTGNGSAPELASLFIKELEKEKLYAPHVLHLGVTVLPFRADPRIGLAEPNALAFSGRFSKVVKTLIIGDNQYIQETKRVNMEEAERKLNELLAWSILGLFFMNYVQTGRYEVADYVAFFSVEGRSSWVVPAFTLFKGEDFIGYLEKWKPEVPVKAIALQLKDNLAAEINTDYEARKLLVIMVVPRAASISGEFEYALRKALSREFNVSEDRVHIAYAYADVRGLAFAFAYVVDPYIKRLSEVYSSNIHFFEADRNRRKRLENLTLRMRTTTPVSIESYERELLSRDVEYLEVAFNQFYEVFEDYLGNWGLTPRRIRENSSTANFFLDLLPRFKEPIIVPRQAHRFNLETILLEEDEPASPVDLAIRLNSTGNFSARNYYLVESLDRTLREMLETAHLALSKEVPGGRPWLCLKLGGTYVPLSDDFLDHHVGELTLVPNLTISLVYFARKRKS